MKQRIRIEDKIFETSIPYQQIEDAIRALAARINADYVEDTKPLFVAVLNGSFMFAAELMKHIAFPCEISFVKLASYHGERSSGAITELIGISDPMVDRDIIIIEDIVDTGNTYANILKTIERHQPRSVKIATLLHKPDVYKYKDTIPLEYVAMEIPNDFIIGFGLDYNGLGRNLPDIYTIVK